MKSMSALHAQIIVNYSTDAVATLFGIIKFFFSKTTAPAQMFFTTQNARNSFTFLLIITSSNSTISIYCQKLI